VILAQCWIDTSIREARCIDWQELKNRAKYCFNLPFLEGVKPRLPGNHSQTTVKVRGTDLQF